ncbi:MAG: hypothetical protein J6D18_00475 [Erysipelotrichaceae bacterium]|nr:hypothetical protein [Erysipelotrichaceae bacterium]
MKLIHLESKDFMECMMAQKQTVQAHPLVLDCGLATMVYLFVGKEQTIYYLDALFTCRPDINQHKENYHSEIYTKVALEMSRRLC